MIAYPVPPLALETKRGGGKMRPLPLADFA
jgi:hypothetical protein